MSLIDELFERLRAESQTAFMPFVTAGDPDLKFTAELLTTLNDSGCHLVELGFPYSDPIADGPVIQASYTRALNNKTSVEGIFEMVASVSPAIKMPIVAMVSYAIIYRFGLEQFVREARRCGISGGIVPDLPIDESAEFSKLCQQSDFSLVQLITPTTTDQRAIEIAQSSSGFIYYVSITGITGERSELPTDLTDRLAWLKRKSDTPVCVGFGISTPEQASMLAPHADGIIVGSAIVRKVVRAADLIKRESIRGEIAAFAQEMIAAIS